MTPALQSAPTIRITEPARQRREPKRRIPYPEAQDIMDAVADDFGMALLDVSCRCRDCVAERRAFIRTCHARGIAALHIGRYLGMHHSSVLHYLRMEDRE